MSEFPYSYVTQKELEGVPMYAVKPNEFKAMMEHYLEREKSALGSLINGLEDNLTIFDKLMEPFFWTARYSLYVNTKVSCSWFDKQTMLKKARDKKYDMFTKLSKEEVDDLVIMSLAYDYTHEVRKIMDFYDRNKEKDNLVYINHYQRRALTWVMTNEKMLVSYINDYYKSNAY